jgi:hypothetical protein
VLTNYEQLEKEELWVRYPGGRRIKSPPPATDKPLLFLSGRLLGSSEDLVDSEVADEVKAWFFVRIKCECGDFGKKQNYSKTFHLILQDVLLLAALILLVPNVYSIIGQRRD